MKRTIALTLAVLVATAVFGGLVHAVLTAAHLSAPSATTIYGVTPRRLWATSVVVLALAGVVIGGLALARPASAFGTSSGPLGVVATFVTALVGLINGVLVLAVANGGPGSGNGVVGGAAALVLGLIGIVLGAVALVRSRRISIGPGRVA
jgi:hypothetical protein